MNEAMTTLDSIKDKITDNEYLTMCNALKTIHDETRHTYEFFVVFTKTTVDALDEDGIEITSAPHFKWVTYVKTEDEVDGVLKDIENRGYAMRDVSWFAGDAQEKIPVEDPQFEVANVTIDQESVAIISAKKCSQS